VHFLPGWFKNTLASAPLERIAVLRLDGDMYESTMEALVHLMTSCPQAVLLLSTTMEPFLTAVQRWKTSEEPAGSWKLCIESTGQVCIGESQNRVAFGLSPYPPSLADSLRKPRI
jgi:hypothetical protein